MTQVLSIRVPVLNYDNDCASVGKPNCCYHVKEHSSNQPMNCTQL